MKILVTGGAGFIGSHLARRLSENGDEVVIIDNLNNYYDPALKIARLNHLGFTFPADLPFAEVTPCSGSDRSVKKVPAIPGGTTFTGTRFPSLRFMRLDICDYPALLGLFARERFDITVNLAAQAGVRYSIENPHAYVESNLVGFINMLEAARRYPVRHFVYASSSSVYGGNMKTPFSEEDRVDSPVSLYAATKKSNELMASVYSGLYKIPTTGLRFFTVYGPWGRPDMAPMLFSDAILNDRPIKVFNNGDLSRDFTYIDDIVEGIVKVISAPSEADTPAEVFNIGAGRPVLLMDFISTLENALGKQAVKEYLPMQPGDVATTFADTSRLAARTGYAPSTTLQEGIARFAAWFTSLSPAPASL